MEKNKNNSKQNEELKILALLVKATIGIILLFMMVAIYLLYLHGPGKNINTIATGDSKKSFEVPLALNESEVSGSIVNGKDEQTGLLAGAGLQIVKVNCTGCHSGALITQNRMSRERWKETIHWMQKTQGLWDLGENEDVILDYLAENYSPLPTGGRRRPLENIKWYSLEN